MPCQDKSDWKAEITESIFPDVFDTENDTNKTENGNNSSKKADNENADTPVKEDAKDKKEEDKEPSNDVKKPTSESSQPVNVVKESKATPEKEKAQTSSTPRIDPTQQLSKLVKLGQSRRVDFPLIPNRMALLVIDIQSHLSDSPSDALASLDDHESNFLYSVSLPSAVKNIESLLEKVRERRDSNVDEFGSEVIFTYLEALTNNCRDVSLDYKLSGPKLSNLPGPSSPATFLDKVQPSTKNGKGDILIPKTSCSIFNSTNIHYVLQNLHIEQLVVCGQLTDQCVESAVRDAADLGYFVTVVQDACAALGLDGHSKGLAGMKGFARIVETEQVLHELKEAGKEGFVPPTLPIIPPDDTTPTTEENDVVDTTPPVDDTPLTPIRTVSDSIIPIKATSAWKKSDQDDASGATNALLHAIRFAGVKFLRLATVDAMNAIRCKAVPLDRILGGHGHPGHEDDEDNRNGLTSFVTIAEICTAGLPSYADYMIPDSKLDAKRVLTVKPDLGSMRILPYANETAMVMGTLHDQVSGELSPLCTRGLLHRVMESAKDEFGIVFTVGAEIEFALFHDDKTKRDVEKDGMPIPVDDSLFGHTTTLNQREEFISDLYNQLCKQNIAVELVHAESASGQLEVVLKHQLDAMKIADNVVLTRETIQAVARAHGMRALFLPKISPVQAGNGMHLHFSFRNLNSNDPKSNAFAHGTSFGLISSLGGSFLEGILDHLPALVSLTIPSVNSFRRVGPGCWTGSDVSWAIEDKESPLRVCIDPATRCATNVELKLSDSMANIYLEIAAVLSAGLHGIVRGLKLRPMAGSNGQKEETSSSLPPTFQKSLECLESDEFLCNVLGKELVTGYVALRRAEIENASSMSLEDEVMHAYRKA